MLFYFQREGSQTCPNCRTDVENFSLIRIFPTEDDKYLVKTKEEMEKIE